jgi:putative alpha-1,2-mannosidase
LAGLSVPGWGRPWGLASVRPSALQLARTWDFVSGPSLAGLSVRQLGREWDHGLAHSLAVT